MFDMSVPWWEFVVRGVVVYLFLLFFCASAAGDRSGSTTRLT